MFFRTMVNTNGELQKCSSLSTPSILVQQHAQGDFEASKDLEPAKVLELLERPNRKVQIGLAEMLKGKQVFFAFKIT